MFPSDSREPAYEARPDPGGAQLLHEQSPEVPRQATDVSSPPWGPATAPFPVIEPPDAAAEPPDATAERPDAAAEPVTPPDGKPRTVWTGPVIVIVALLAGFLAGEFVAWINGAGWRREARRRARRVEALERELLATQAQLPRAPSGLPVQHPTRD